MLQTILKQVAPFLGTTTVEEMLQPYRKWRRHNHIANDTTQLGGNLDLNSYDITGTGDVNTRNIDATWTLM